MAQVGCLALVVIALLISFLMAALKDPFWGPTLIVSFVATIVVMVVRSKGRKQASDFLPTGQRQAAARGRALSPAERANEKLIQLSRSLPNVGIAQMALKSGEELIYKLEGVSLVESRSNGSRYVGGSSGFNIKIAKGLYYRVGASKGQLIKNEESLQNIDRGTAIFTNRRIIFSGLSASREWSFDKLTNIGQSEYGDVLLISVSNRQKTSGISSRNAYDILPGKLAAVALEYSENGLAAAKDRCLKEAGVYSDFYDEYASKTEKPNEPEDALFPNAELGKPGSKPALSTSQGENLVPSIDEGEEILDVVGESFYAPAFELLRLRYQIDFGDTVDFDLDLVAEPFNKFSKNGNAVAVQLDGHVIGHISEDENTEFFQLLKGTNGRAKCKGEIYFAPVTERMKNSVRLFCNFPPELE